MIFRLKATSGPLAGQAFDLSMDLTGVGSSPSQDVVISGLKAQHAKIHGNEHQLVIEPVADAPVFVNGEAISGPIALQSGDEIRLGTVHLMLQAPGLRPQRVLDTVSAPRSRRWIWWLVGMGALGALAAYGLWKYPNWLQGLPF